MNQVSNLSILIAIKRANIAQVETKIKKAPSAELVSDLARLKEELALLDPLSKPNSPKLSLESCPLHMKIAMTHRYAKG